MKSSQAYVTPEQAVSDHGWAQAFRYLLLSHTFVDLSSMVVLFDPPTLPISYGLLM